MFLYIGDVIVEKFLKNNEKFMVWYCCIFCVSMLVLYMYFLLYIGNIIL